MDRKIVEQTPSAVNGKSPVPGGGAGMDRVIQKRNWPPKRIAGLVAIVLFVGLVGFLLLQQRGGAKLRIDAERVTIAEVTRADFQEFIAVTGVVEPLNTFFLDAVEGGRVEDIYLEEGSMVSVGDPILRLTNNNLQLNLLNQEAQVAETINYLRQARLAMEQNSLSLRQQLVDINYQIQRLEKDYNRRRQLYEKQLISQEEFELVEDEYEYQKQRMDLTRLSHQQDSLLRDAQVDQLEASVSRMERNLDIVRQNLENLVVRAPLTGQLTSLNAEIGQSIGGGQRLGQVDQLDGFKVNVPVDEFYLSRIVRGLEGRFTFAGEDYVLGITKVYPEIEGGRFEVDMEFIGAMPEGIRRGQTARINLQLGDLSEALLIPRGGFYQTTGGNAIFVVNAAGDQAVRRPIQIGRQNPQFFEVLSGLEAGERVITSSYDTYGEVDILILEGN